MFIIRLYVHANSTFHRPCKCWMGVNTLQWFVAIKELLGLYDREFELPFKNFPPDILGQVAVCELTPGSFTYLNVF